MKTKKIVSWISVAALMIANFTAISVPAVAATGISFSEDFEGYNEVSGTYSVIDIMDDLYKDGWSVATVNGFTARDASDIKQRFAQVVKDGSNKVLELSTANSLGIKLDPSTETPSGSYAVSFKFKPVNSGKFNLSLNSFNDAAAVANHNILYSDNNTRMFMGHRTNTVNVPLTNMGAPEAVWYEVKCVVNNDAGFYSVELYKDGKLVARRAPINYAGSEVISFLKFSAGSGTKIYVDDVSISSCDQETLIYEDDFDSYSTVQRATTYVQIPSSTEAKSMEGGSFFEGYSPWRAVHAKLDENNKEAKGDYYDLVHSDELNSQVLKLGEEKDSAMIYMPLDGALLTKESQLKRGKLKLTYKFRDYTNGVGYATAVDLVNAYNYSNSWAYLPQVAILEKKLGSPAVAGQPYLKTDGLAVKINQALWYEAEVIFDVINDNILTVIKELDSKKEIANFSHKSNWIAPDKATTIETIKAINFRALSKSAIYIDDVKLEYYIPDPKISGSNIVIKDYKGNVAEDKNDVSPAVTSIELSFGAEMAPASTNTSTVTIKDSKDVIMSYTPSYGIDSYIIYPDKFFTPGETYTLYVSKNVETTFGRKLDTDFEYTFTVSSDYPELMELADISVGLLSDITNGSTIKATINYANSSSTSITSMPFIAYYGDGMMLATSCDKQSPVAAGDKGSNTVTFTVPSASELDLSKVDKVSVCLWKGFANSAPYSKEITLETSSTSTALSDTAVTGVSKPVVKYSYADSVLNISGTTKSDSKYLTVQILKPGNTFATGDTLSSSAADATVFYRAQIPVKDGKYSLDVRFDIKGNPAPTLVEDDYPTAIYLDDTKLDINNVYLISYKDFVTAYNELNAAAVANDLTAFETVLNTKRSALNFDSELLGSTALGSEITPYFDYIKANPLSVANEAKNTATFNSYIAMNYLNTSAVTDISSSINNVQIDENVKKLCNEVLNTEEKSKYFTKLLSGKSISTVAQLEKEIDEALILTATSYGNGFGQLKSVLEACGTSISITSPVSEEACRNLMGKNYANATAFQLAYNAEVARLATPSPSKNDSSPTKIALPLAETSPVIPDAKPIKKSFNDIDNYEWAMQGILALADRNIINGVDEDRFEPGRNITREEFAKILVGALGASNYEYKGNRFGDASDGDWFVKYINIAANIGIVNGIGNGMFGTGRNITRQDMAVMLYNALKYRNVDMQTDGFKFDDDGQIADYAKDAVSALHDMGAINGMTATTFAPGGLATRAQAARIVYSVLEKLQG